MGLTATHALEPQELPGELPVKAQCLPFKQIPHTTPLFADFLSNSPKLTPFYPRNVSFREWLREETPGERYEQARRERVADVLQRQNTAWGASRKTLDNIARLRAGASAVVTGQQVGLFGGPLFSLFKALSAVKLAGEATQAGIDCVPLFWLATQDHDLAEINHVTLLGAGGTLEKLSTSSRGGEDAPVGAVRLGPEIIPVVENAVSLLGDSEVSAFLRESYAPGETLGGAFARLFTRLFADWGVILLDASDAEMNAVAEPVYRGAIERAAQLDEALLARGRDLEAAGFHQQVKVTPASTLLFALRDGARTPIRRRGNGNSTANDFAIGKEIIPQAKLLDWIAGAPQDFSANALLRPVVQDYLLPTLTYIGGAAEVAYFAQAEVVYQALLGHVTPILPRFSATLIESKPQGLLERYHLSLPNLFHGTEPLQEELAKRTLPQDLQAAFSHAESALEKSLDGIRSALSRLDVTLVEAASGAGSKMHYQLDRLRSRAARAELLRSEVLARHAQLLSNVLYPHKVLQEREIGGLHFVARYGIELLHRLYDHIHTDCLDHQVIEL